MVRLSNEKGFSWIGWKPQSASGNRPSCENRHRNYCRLFRAINPSEWQFEMFLCNNDMVLWDVDDPDWQQRDKIYLEEKNQHLPIYRLQKMTEGTLTFRHFSVTSTADTGNRGVLRRSPTKLCCKKIRIDELGDYNIC